MPARDESPEAPASPSTTPGPIPRPARFTWPPNAGIPPEHGGVNVASSLAARTPLGAPRYEPTTGRVEPLSLWDRLEETWLGVHSPSWARRVRESNWSPEPPGLWCPRCGRSVGDFEASAEGCASCRDAMPPWQGVVRLGPYEGLLRDAVLEVKHAGWRRLASDVGRELGVQVAHMLALQGWHARPTMIVPVPMAWRKRLFRPLDHAMALARGVRAGLAGVEPAMPPVRLIQPLLRKATPTQQALSFPRRRRNVARTMRPKPWFVWEQLRGQTIVLVDDVMTSGATLEEACRALRAGMADAGLERGSGREEVVGTGFSVVVAVVGVAGEREAREGGGGA